ncbi:hypothetical protein BC832DRAFT_562927 [Gaertneriomyces semiglobifer]|nr:hypothetical protein BC832DRAFT_562927 [Gaertneriomyces semiglobifer]
MFASFSLIVLAVSYLSLLYRQEAYHDKLTQCDYALSKGKWWGNTWIPDQCALRVHDKDEVEHCELFGPVRRGWSAENATNGEVVIEELGGQGYEKRLQSILDTDARRNVWTGMLLFVAQNDDESIANYVRRHVGRPRFIRSPFSAEWFHAMGLRRTPEDEVKVLTNRACNTQHGEHEFCCNTVVPQPSNVDNLRAALGIVTGLAGWGAGWLMLVAGYIIKYQSIWVNTTGDVRVLALLSLLHVGLWTRDKWALRRARASAIIGMSDDQSFKQAQPWTLSASEIKALVAPLAIIVHFIYGHPQTYPWLVTQAYFVIIATWTSLECWEPTPNVFRRFLGTLFAIAALGVRIDSVSLGIPLLVFLYGMSAAVAKRPGKLEFAAPSVDLLAKLVAAVAIALTYKHLFAIALGGLSASILSFIYRDLSVRRPSRDVEHDMSTAPYLTFFATHSFEAYLLAHIVLVHVSTSGSRTLELGIFTQLSVPMRTGYPAYKDLPIGQEAGLLDVAWKVCSFSIIGVGVWLGSLGWRTVEEAIWNKGVKRFYKP